MFSFTSKGSASSPNDNADTWDNFIEGAMLYYEGLAGAAIVGLEDGVVWGSSTPDVLTTEEYSATFETEEGNESQAQVLEGAQIAQFMQTRRKPPSGLRIGQKKWMVLRTLDYSTNALPSGRTIFSVYGKCGSLGCCLALADKSVVVTTCNQNLGQTASHCNAVALRTATWLLLNGL
jgi:hypothetical protein